jgi:CRISPR-associated protein Cmr6
MRNRICAIRNRWQHAEHAGLLLQRYLTIPVKDKRHPDERKAFLDAARNAASRALELYSLAFARWKDSFDGDDRNVSADLRTRGRLIVGLGSQNVLETGLRLHHTYGVPIIAGSALKGLAAHYCDQVWGRYDLGDSASEESKRFRKRHAEPCHEYHKLLFGTTDDGGVITFHDAWITPESLNGALKRDVMTPHHPKWQDGSLAPSDFDSPVPVPYLSVAGTFRIVVSWNGPESDQREKWTNLTMSLLKEALEEWGIGGKTSSGYGRLVDPQAMPTAKLPTGASAQRRPSGTSATVRIIEARPKGGFNVQEEGYPQGTLTVGTPPNPLPTIGSVVKVVVHIDDLKHPQYRWS